jgi:erythromycin esterase
MRVSNVLFALAICTWLNACGGGSSGSDSVPVDTQVYPDLTMSQLLSNAELSTPPPPSSVTAPSAVEAQWLRDRSRPLRSVVVDTDFSDLAFLENELAGKRIVQLGESSHGAREFNMMKVRMIKYMHEKLGYDVLAFESSLIACHLQNKELPTSTFSPLDMTRRCIFPVWQTAELNELFRYIKSTQSSARPLRLAGFDIQFSGELDSINIMRDWVLGLTNEVDPAASARVSTAFRAIDNAMQTPSTSTIASIATASAPVIDLLREGSARASVSRRVDFETAILAFKVLQDRQRYTLEVGQRLENQTTRERGMADALTGLAERVYPGEKIMAWAHNAHIATHVEYYSAIPPMGAYLKQTWGDQLFTIGLFMLRGENVTDFRTRVAVRVKDPGRGSLEEIAYSLKLAAAYVPIERGNQTEAGDDWQHRSIQFRSWGTIDHLDALSANYNAVIMIDHTSVPRYN